VKLVLFFTYGVSLRNWAESGLLEREIALYRELAKRAVEVTFVTYGDESDHAYAEAVAPIKIVPFYALTAKPRSRCMALLRSCLLPRQISELIASADVLKTNQMNGSWVAILAKRKHRKKLVLRYGFDFHRFLCWQGFARSLTWPAKLLSKTAYRYADAAIVTTRDMAEYATSNYKADPEKIYVIPNFINTELFKPLETPRRDRVLYIGRLSPQKNVRMLLDAVSQTTYGLDIIGQGPLYDELQRYAEAERVDVAFLGMYPNSELPGRINRYAVFVLPSHYEGHPKTLLEAMSCGVAAIGTDVPGIREIVRHEDTGLLCGRDVRALRTSIVRLMEDEELRRRLGRNARQYVVEHCDCRAVADNEFAIYRSLMREPSDTTAPLGLVS
jgi:glycosyltransferase involved in cell wall biosynthesis